MNPQTPFIKNLPGVLDQALRVSQGFFPGAAVRAEKALSLLLGKKLLPSAQKGIWNSSSLAKGSPVEFTFKTNQQGIQYTLDLTDPEESPDKTLRRTLDELAQLTDCSLPENDLLFFEKLQKKGGLAYGCWIGGRHKTDEDEYKVYVEVPDGADDMAMDWLTRNTSVDFSRLPFRQNQNIKPEIIGYSLKKGAIECYFSIVGLAPWEVHTILEPVAMEERQEYLLDLLQALSYRAIYRKFPTREMGFSYAFAPVDNCSAFSIYTFASAVLGDDKQVRETLLSLAGEKGWNMDYYRVFTQPIAARDKATYTHGLIGISIDGNGRTAVYTGLSPAFYLHSQDSRHD